MNIRDIAKKAGVSVATISRVINQETRGKVAPETLRKVDELIHKYGYTPNLAARNLNKSSTKTIGVLFPYFYSLFYHSYYVNILAGLADSLINTEYQLKILLLRERPEKWDRYDFRKGEDIDGLVVTHWPEFFSNKSIIEQMNIPCVVVSDYRKNMKAFFVGGDQLEGGQKAAEYLYSLGHRRMAVLTGHDRSIDGDMRLEGFKRYLRSKKVTLDPHWIIKADYREDTAYERVDQLFEEKKRPSAIFCLNDRMALGVLRKLRELHIKCPQEVSVMGFDNDPLGKDSQPALTSINIPLYYAAAEGASRMVAYLKSPSLSTPLTGAVFFPPNLVVRSSVQKMVSR